MKLRVPVLSLVLAGLLGGASFAAQSTPSPNLAGIAHVALRVQNLAASVAFYEKLGFVKAFELSRDGKVYEAFIKINDRQFIELYPVDAKNMQAGFLHLCFEGNDLKSLHDYYVAGGLKPTDVKKAGAGNLLFTMPGPMTPTGPQNLEYTQYMPGSLHSKDFGQHLGAAGGGLTLVEVDLATEDTAAARSFYLEKLGFIGHAEAIDYVGLPGATANYGLRIVPAQPLGLKARITFVTNFGQAESLLREHGGTFSPSGPGSVIRMSDPDGNTLLVRIIPLPPPGSR